jgi:hypothetical protein
MMSARHLGGFLFAILLLGAAAPSASADATDQLIRLNAEMQHATENYDVATLARMISPNYELISSGGKVYDRDAFLADAADRSAVYELNELEDVSVHLYSDDAAIVTAVLHVKYHTKDKQVDTRIRYGDLWVKENGEWKYVFGEASPIRK